MFRNVNAPHTGTSVARRIFMNANRLWLGIVIVGSTTAFALALLLATIGVVAGTAVDAFGQDSANHTAVVRAATERTYEGVVTCSRCGARHPADSHETAATCSRACVRSGDAFALVDGETIYVLDGDRDLINRFAGQRAQVGGLIDGNKIRVSSMTAAK
jgi:hypothetical protein